MEAVPDAVEDKVVEVNVAEADALVEVILVHTFEEASVEKVV